jgi:copper homeostasis protein
MVRPRPGDFCYSEREFEVMMHDVATAKRLGSDGVVLGILMPDGSIDAERTRKLLVAARPMSVTFHKAIDASSDIIRAFDDIVQLGIDRVLTSGGKADVLAGADVLRELVKRSHGRVKVLAGGGVSFDNVMEVVKLSGVMEVHALSALLSESTGPSGNRPRVVDPDKVRMMIDFLNRISS